MKILKRGIAQITDATIGYGIVAIILVSVLIPLSQWAAERTVSTSRRAGKYRPEGR
nr:exported hypothetical protein [Serratia symbiotica]